MVLQTLGNYELLEELGHGGYGTVYRAHETVLDVVRAVKVLHPALVSVPEFVERFRKEARFSARLEHAHIVQVYELGEADGRYYLSMKYLPGGSLKDLLAQKGRLPYGQALEILRQVSEALTYAQTQPERLIHRDLKPGNILFERLPDAAGNLSIRLSDFGLAKALADSGSGSASSSGTLLGTPAYMAPEVWNGKPPVSPATDQYSLACVLFEMLTGQVLFSGETPPVVMKQHIIDGPQFPAQWPEGVPAAIETVLRRALAADLAERYPDADAFYRACAGLLKPEVAVAVPVIARPTIPPPSEPAVSADEPSEPPSKSFLARYWLVGALVLLVAAFLSGRLFAPAPDGSAVRMVVTITNPPVAAEVISTVIPPTATHLANTATPAPSSTPAPTAVPTLGIGSTQTRARDGMLMVYVPAGPFTMGDSADQALVECQKYRTDCQKSWFTNEEPAHSVNLSAFWLDQTEVTNGEYALCVQKGGCRAPFSSASATHLNYYTDIQFADFPVVNVDWNQAESYCTWAGVRLPTEAEWEKAARGPDGRTYPWGEGLEKSRANYGNNIGDTTKVGSYVSGASLYGAYDLAGNVWEWVNDWYGSGYYGSSPDNDPQGPATGTQRVLRGGSWSGIGDLVRSALRYGGDPSYTSSVLGFRCASSK